jgi:hypothetical protein
MSTTDSSPATNDIEGERRHLLDGLMASDSTAWEHSLYRTRLYAGYKAPTDSWVPRAHASMRERAGKWGVAPEEMHGTKDENGKPREAPFNSQVSKAYASITNKKWWERDRSQFGLAKDGPYTPFKTKCLDNFPAERAPAKSTLAYAAIKSLSLHVSPLGPERELALCRVWFRVGRDNILVGTRKDWAGWLGCKTEKWAVQWLRDFEAANVGVALEVLPPPAHEKAKLYVVRLSLPPIEHLIRPSGGQRRQEEDAAYERFTTALSKLPKPDAQYFIAGPEGTMVPVEPLDDDYREVLPDEFEQDVSEADTEPEAEPADEAAVPVVPEIETAPETDAVTEVFDESQAHEATMAVEPAASAEAEKTVPSQGTENPEPLSKTERVRAALNIRLHDAAEANGQRDRELAGEILKPVLAAIPTHIAKELFGGDEADARSVIVEAFKRGQHELGGAVTRAPDNWAVDYLQSSSKPHAGRLALEGEASPAPKKEVIVDEQVNRTPLPTAPMWDDGYEEDVPFDDEDVAETSETVKTATSAPPTETEAPNPTAEPQEPCEPADTADAAEEGEAAPPFFDDELAVDTTMEEMRERFGIVAEDEVETASVA